VQPAGRVISQPGGHRFVTVAVGHLVTPVLDRRDVGKFAERPVQLDAGVNAPQVGDRIQNERIINSVAPLIFLAEGNVHAAGAHAQHPVPVPEPGDIFEIEVQLAEFGFQAVFLRRSQIQFPVKINIVPDGRVRIHPRFCDAEIVVRISAVPLGTEHAHAPFAAQFHVAEIQCAAPGRGLGFGRVCLQLVQLLVVFGGYLLDGRDAIAQDVDGLLLLLHLLLQQRVLLRQAVQLPLPVRGILSPQSHAGCQQQTADRRAHRTEGFTSAEHAPQWSSQHAEC